ncbi:ABC transporter ATP-binding protein [Sporosarcina sp. YIM B06819]|uniref:ABC transporter ATP-binding protein n=1 Tax=Sporosarcina sp. YIM B06819 TaxID=3081769 RepID=UPI00298C01B7|nr:ABC transporter ATP-binding protein [Sporosarcina sp. YIM B06819]
MQKKIQAIRMSMKNATEVWGYLKSVLWQASKPLTLILLMLGLFSGLTLIAELLAITTLINRLVEYDPSHGSFGMAIQSLLPWVVIFIGAILIKQAAQSIQPYISMQLQEKASSILKEHIFSKALQLDLESFETEDYYNQLENAKKAINHRLTWALESIGLIIASIVELVVVIVAISKSGILLALVLIVGSVPLIMINLKSTKEFMKINYQQSPTKRHSQYWMGLSTSRQTAAELRLFGLGPYFLGKWERLSEQLIGELYTARKKMAWLRVKGETILILLLAMMMIGIVFAGVKGTITVGALVALLYMLNRFEQAIGQVSGHSETLADFHYSFQYIPRFLQAGKEELASGLQAPEVIEQGIQFENVSFTYPGSTKESLKRINLHIAPGEKVALVGENGAGKSTLALLLLGLYQPTEGRIVVDGVDLTDINPIFWRRKAAAVFQNFVKYQLSATENITFGNLADADNEQKLTQVAKRSRIDAVLRQLPNGYDTLLGKEYENSKDLSGGEWQKVAITRAYYREADILVLDEPTAALDAQSEYEVYKQFSQVSEGKTTLLISHRLGSARLADKNINLQAGQVVEIGSHDELIGRNGPYATMYHLQAEWYQ